jgi:hypothetical protein
MVVSPCRGRGLSLLPVLQVDAEESRKAHRDREHTLEMLMMDKAYLSKEVEALSDRERRLELDLESRDEKV